MWPMMFEMTVSLSPEIQRILEAHAARTGRGVNEVVEDAVRQYFAAGDLKDVAAEDVGETQLRLLDGLNAGPWDNEGQAA